MDSLEIVVDELSKAFPDVDVSTEVPAERPERLVWVKRDGGGGDEFLDRPRVSLTCYGASDVDAEDICLGCVDALQEAAQVHPYLSHCELETMSRDSWSVDGTARYRAVVDLVVNK